MESLTLSAVDQGAIDALINRKNVITIPVYLLHWVPYAGVHQVILRIALEQLFYLNQLSQSDGRLKADLSRYAQAHDVDTRYRDIARWCAMSQRTVIRHLDESPLFEKSNQGCEVVDDHYQQKANRYRLPALRLTPGDAQDLLKFIHQQKAEGASLAQLLDKLEKTALSDIASQKPYHLPQKDDLFSKENPPTLRALLTQVYGPPSKDQLGRIEKLQFDLMNPLDAYITVPWYWFRELLPIVGHHELCAYLMCLPLTYRDRTTFNLTGGAKRIANWVGKSTLSLAFPRGSGKNSRSSAAARKLAKQRALLSLLFQPQENKKGKKNTYRIGLKRNPLLPHHQAALFTLFSTPTEDLPALKRSLEALEAGSPEEAVDPTALIGLLQRTVTYLETQKTLAFDNLNLEKCLASDNLKWEKVLAFVNPNNEKSLAFDKPKAEISLAFDNLNPKKDLASDNHTPQKVLALDTLLKILNGFKIPQLIHQMPSCQDSPLSSRGEMEGRETKQKSLQMILLSLIDQDIPPTEKAAAAAWLLDGLLKEEIHDPPGYAHYKAVQKKRPAPENLLPLLAVPLDMVLACLESRTALDLAYYSADPGQKAVYAALHDVDWRLVQRLRERVAETGKYGNEGDESP